MTPFAILCPGQGAQSSTMFDLVLDVSEAAKVIGVFSNVSRIDLVARTAANDRLDENAYAQPAIVAAAVATWTVLARELPPPTLFAGYSVGEVSSWACAGAWDVAAAAAVTRQRALAMDGYGPANCGLLAVRGLPRDEIERCGVDLFVAIVNGSDHVVLAGPDEAITAASLVLAARGAWTRRLDVRVPSHTRLMQEAALRFGDETKANPPQDVEARVLRGIDGAPCRRGVDAMNGLTRAICETIRWDACQQALAEAGIRVALELGPGRALTALCAVECPDIVVRSVADFRSLRGAADWLLRQVA